MKAAALSGVLVATALAGCTRTESRNKPDDPAPTATPSTVQEPTSASIPPSVAMDFVAPSELCSFGHRGILLDLGDRSTRTHVSRAGRGAADIDVRERDGASWLLVRERMLSLTFVSSDEIAADAGVVIEARMRGALAKSVSVHLDGKAIGKLSLAKGEAKTVSIVAPASVVSRGEHELRLGFNGGPRTAHEDLAEIDWVRVGPNDGGDPYAAPTRSDAVATVAVGGVAKRSVLLRAPGFARCEGYVPAGATLETSLGVTGGRAEAEVRVVVDRQEPRVVGRFQLGGEEDPAWKPVTLPLGDVGTIASVELVAKSSTKGARVLFADPRIVAPRAAEIPKKEAASRGVVVVILGTTSPRSLSTYGGSVASPELDRLATSGVVFDAHRATTSYANGSVASLLTGLPAQVHEVESPDAKLDARTLTIAEAARQAGVVTAMFTANPTTSAPFGFGRGWETFTARFPNAHEPATIVFDDAARWLDDHRQDRFLIVVHARGGHPPWDVTDDELRDLPPTDYAGALEPKHAGDALAKAKRAGGARLFADADRERAFALHGRAVAAHDAALGRLVEHVKALGRDADTTWIVTGDVGFDPSVHVPFLEDDALDEAALAIPLVVDAPGSSTGGSKHVTVPTSTMDLAKTVLDAFGLPPPTSMRGESIWALGQGPYGDMRPMLATSRTRYAMRWAGFVVLGAKGREGKFCSLSIEPDCISDIGPVHPFALDALRTQISLETSPGSPGNTATRPAPPPGPAAATPLPSEDELDPDTARALRAWGR